MGAGMELDACEESGSPGFPSGPLDRAQADGRDGDGSISAGRPDLLGVIRVRLAGQCSMFALRFAVARPLSCGEFPSCGNTHIAAFKAIVATHGVFEQEQSEEIRQAESRGSNSF